MLRSLTKTWALAGLRAGYVVGDPELVARLRGQQPPWSVSTPALAATVACLGRPARAEGEWRQRSGWPRVTPADLDGWVCKLRVELGVDNGADFIRDALQDLRGRTDPAW